MQIHHTYNAVNERVKRLKIRSHTHTRTLKITAENETCKTKEKKKKSQFKKRAPFATLHFIVYEYFYQLLLYIYKHHAAIECVSSFIFYLGKISMRQRRRRAIELNVVLLTEAMIFSFIGFAMDLMVSKVFDGK